MLSFQVGILAGEVAALMVGNVQNDDGTIRDRIHLQNNQNKDDRQRTVILSKKLQPEILHFVGNLTGFREKQAFGEGFHVAPRQDHK